MHSEQHNLSQGGAPSDYGQPNNDQNAQDKVQGRWDQDQHRRFLEGLFKFGKNWKEIETLVGTRMCSQVRSHAQKYFIKLQKILKDRKKQKNRLTADLTQIEKEILQNFTQKDITNKTPDILISLLEHSCLMPKPKSAEKPNIEEQPPSTKVDKPAKKVGRSDAGQEGRKGQQQVKPEHRKSSEQTQKNKNQSIIRSYYDQGLEDDKSFFRQLMESNVQHFRKGKDFMDFIDFDNKHIEQTQKPEEVDSSESTRNRRSSFTLVDDLQNEHRLKEALDKIKCGQHC